jgi:membrane-bound ClpP family serine protease
MQKTIGILMLIVAAQVGLAGLFWALAYAINGFRLNVHDPYMLANIAGIGGMVCFVLGGLLVLDSRISD